MLPLASVTHSNNGERSIATAPAPWDDGAHSVRPTVNQEPPASSLFASAFDAVAMELWPLVAACLGYRFRCGTNERLARDGHRVHDEVWREVGVVPAPGLEHIGRRYDDATRQWIVAYHRGVPVGVMALLDPSRASPALDYGNHSIPDDVDPRHTAEIARLAVVRAHRGGAQTVMIGLLREMLRWIRASGVTVLLAGAKARLFPIYARYNPTARRIDPPHRAAEDPDMSRWYSPIRAYGGEGVVFTFSVAGAMPWTIFTRFLMGRLRPRVRG